VSKAPPAPTAFLDRDGTINRDRAGVYITQPAQLKIYSKAPAALKLIAAKGYRIVVITNQSGVARGYMTLAASKAVNLAMVRTLGRLGVKIDAVYFCPHGPGEACACRKPATGLLLEAARYFPYDRKNSFVAGDRASDLRLAANAGIKAFPVLTGQWRSLPPAAARAGHRDLLALARALPDLSAGTVGGHKRKIK
jgi:histidinol-phosphate phosphatase family protein